MPFDKKSKGLGLALNKRPSSGGAKPMPYTPGQDGGAKTMPYTPGSGVGAKTMPYRPNKPRLDPVRKMSYDAPVMDSLGDPSPPGYADTMEYVPERDGSAYTNIPNYEGEGIGAENLGDNEEWDAMWDQALAEVPENEADIPAFRDKWIKVFVESGMDPEQAETWVDQLFTDGL